MKITNCQLCPRNCLVDRSKTFGYCKAPNAIKIARAALYFDEEPPISGKNGCGSIFFSSCPLGCIFCQNRDIAHENFGQEISMKRLIEIFFELQEEGACSINLVSPTPYLPFIKEAIMTAKKQGFSLPFVYNTSGYEKVESLRQLEGLIDIYLPDFKYAKEKTALAFSHCPDYVQKTKEALKEMVRQTGKNTFDANGLMKKGVLVRHLILPAHEDESKTILSYLHKTYQDKIYISIMNQYTPIPSVKNHPILKKKIDPNTYQEVIDYAIAIGIQNAYIQEGDTAKTCFIPSFQLEGVLKKEKKEV